jgi:hypothetical protein
MMREMRASPWILGLSALAAAGCAATTVDQSFRKEGLAAAAFEMACPIEQVQLTYLNCRPDEVDKVGRQIGVSGCGKRVVYFRAWAGWVANSSAAAAETRPHVPVATQPTPGIGPGPPR